MLIVSFHTYSAGLPLLSVPTVVPPQASTHGSVAGILHMLVAVADAGVAPGVTGGDADRQALAASVLEGQRRASRKDVGMPPSPVGSSPWLMKKLEDSTDGVGSPACGKAAFFSTPSPPASSPR